MALAALMILLAPYAFMGAASAQTKIPPPGADIPIDGGGQQLSPGAAQTQSTDPNSPYYNANGYTTMIQQAAEQNTQGVITNTNNQLLQGSELGQYNDVYAGVSKFWGDDIVSNLFQNIGQLIGRWLSELVNGWISDTVQFLTAFLRTFVLNPNIAVNGLNQNPNGANGSNQNDDISPYIRQGADTMYGIAVDLLLLLFILCIWKYWADAAWRGGVNMMGAVGRLIFTAGLLLAWPTIYAFEIQISNEMIKAIYFNSTDQVAMLDAAMASAVKGGLVAGIGLLANAFAPVIGTLGGGAAAAGGGGLVLGTVGGIVAFAGLVIYVILGGVLIAELVYIIVLKAIQTALLTAQYMFAPIFIVFFATPDTENVCSGFVRSFVEVSLWTFVWVGLLKIMVIILFSDFNPWGKIIMAIGVLQLMIQVPAFLARAQISPASDFISAGMISGGLTKGLSALGSLAATKSGQAVDYLMNQKYSARGLAQSEKATLNNLPRTSYDKGLLGGIRDGAKGTGNIPTVTPPPKPPDVNGPKKPGSGGTPTKPVTNPPTGPRRPGSQGDPNDPKNKNKIDPTTGKPFKNEKHEHKPGQHPGQPGPRRPGSAGAPGTTPTGATAPGTAQTPKTGNSGSTTSTSKGAAAGALERLGRGGKIAGGAALAGGAIAALGAMPRRSQQDADQAEKERKLKQAKESAEQMLANEQKENSNLKAGNDKPEDEKRKHAKEFAAQHLKGHAEKHAQSLADKADKAAGGAADGAGTGTATASLKAGKGKIDPTTGKPATGLGGGGGNADPKLTVANAAGGNAQQQGPRRPGSAGSPKPSDAKLNLGGIATQKPKGEQEKNKEKGANEHIEAEHEPEIKGLDPTNNERDQKLKEGTVKGGAEPKLDVKGSLLGNAPVPPIAKPKVPGRDSNAASKRGGADPSTVESTTKVGQAKSGGQSQQQQQQARAGQPKVPDTTGKSPTLNRGTAEQLKNGGRGQSVEQEVEQGADSEHHQHNAAEGLRIGTVVRPVIPMGTRAAHEAAKGPDVKGRSTAGGGTVKSTSTGSAGGNVSHDLKQGSAVAGKGVMGPTANGGRPIAPPDGGRLAQGKTHVNSERVSASGRGYDMEATEDANLVTTMDALGQPVTVRMNTRLHQQQQAGGAGRTAQNLQSGNVQHVGTATGANLGGIGIAAGPASRAPVAAQNLASGGNTGTRASLAGSTLHSMAVTQARHIDPSTSGSVPDQVEMRNVDGNNGGVEPPKPSPGAAGPPQLPFDKYTQAGYRWVPPRNLAIDIRTAQGPTMGPSPDGKAQIIGDGKGHVNHVRFGANATPEQKALQVIAAGYAQTFSSDSEAFDAARSSAIDAGEDAPKNMTERMAAGYLAANGKSFKQTAVAKQRFQKSLFKHAVLGAEAYVSGQDGNAFTEYLKTRYGEMTPEQQAWGVHIMTDDTSPESGWSPKVGPATDTLAGAGIPVTAGYRAAAANPSVLKQPAWGRGPAIRGVKAYAASIVNSQCAPNTHPMVKDAMIGRIAQNEVGAAEVGACLAIMLESPTVEKGERACEDREMVQSVAQLVTDGKQKDYVNAYRSMKTVVNLAGGGARMSTAGGSTNQSMRMSAPASSGGSVQSVSSGVSIGSTGGGYGGGGGGPVQTNLVDVNMDGSNANFSSAPPVPPSFAGPPVRTQTEFNYRANQGVGNTQRHSVSMPVQGTPGGQDVRIVGNGGNSALTNRVELDVMGTVMNNGNNLGNMHNLVPPTQQHVRQQIDVNVVTGGGGGSTSGGRYSVNMPVSGQSSSDADVRVVGGGGGQSEYITNQSVVDAYSEAAGGRDASGAVSSDIAAAGQAAANSNKSSIYVAQSIIMQMHTAGFADDQIQDPRIAQAAMDVYRHEPSMLGTAAVTAKIMGPQEFNRGTTQTVQAMIDSGWSANRISRPDVYTAQAIMANGGGNPTPDYVQVVRVLPQYSPRPNGELPGGFAAQIAKAQAAGQRDDYIRNMRMGRPQ